MSKIIDVQHLSFQYPSSDVKALDDISFSVEAGEWVAIIGHNGSGKSTLAKLLNRLLVTDTGEMTVAGLAVNDENTWDIREKVGMVFQNPDNQFVGATVADDVAFGMENRGVERELMIQRVDDALAEVQMSEFADREPVRLSGGQKQRVAIAGVIAVTPEILILDEATSMLDPQGRREVIKVIRDLKARMGNDLTVLSITHDIDEAASADHIIVINDGKIVETGVPAEVFGNGPALIKLGLDVPFAEQLKEELRQMGVSVPAEYLDEEGMVKWLWQSSFNK